MEFGELKRKFDELKVLVWNQETRVRYHETRANNIAMAYLTWERLFVFGISHTSSSLSLNCTHWWMLLGLSLSSSFLYFLFFLEAVFMLYRAQNHLDIISKKQIQISQHILDVGGLSMEAGDHSISSDGFEFNFHVQVLEYHPCRILHRKVYIASTVSALLAVTAFELYMCKYSLCN